MPGGRCNRGEQHGDVLGQHSQMHRTLREPYTHNSATPRDRILYGAVQELRDPSSKSGIGVHVCADDDTNDLGGQPTVHIHSATAALSLPYLRRRLSRDYDPVLSACRGTVCGTSMAMTVPLSRNVCVRWAAHLGRSSLAHMDPNTTFRRGIT